MRKKSTLIIFGIIIIIALILIVVVIGLTQKPSQIPTNAGPLDSGNVTESPIVFNKEDEERIVLNFKDGQVAIFGFPGPTNKSNFKLFQFVYIDYIDSVAEFESQMVQSGDNWESDYVTRMDSNTAYFALKDNKWHQISWLKSNELNEYVIAGGCATENFSLVEGFVAKKISCNDDKNSCYLPINEDQGLLYADYNSNSGENFCQNLLENNVGRVGIYP